MKFEVHNNDFFFRNKVINAAPKTTEDATIREVLFCAKKLVIDVQFGFDGVLSENSKKFRRKKIYSSESLQINSNFISLLFLISSQRKKNLFLVVSGKLY